MSFKEFYSKQFGDRELCIVCGYVGDNKCNVFYRDKDWKTIKDYGILQRDEAFNLYAKLKNMENEAIKNEN